MTSGLIAADSPAEGSWLTPVRCAQMAALILLVMPPFFALATFEGRSVSDLSARNFSIPVVFAEGLVTWLALRAGFDPIAAWRRLTVPTKVAAVTWLGAVVLAAVFAWREPTASWIWAIITFFHAAFAFALYDRFADNWKHHRAGLLDALAIGLASYLVIAVLLTLSIWDAPDYQWIFFGIGVSNIRQVCFYGFPLIAIAAARLGANSSTRAQGRHFLLLATGIFAVVWSGGRANVLAAVGALLVAFAMSKGTGRMRLVLGAIGATVIALPLSLVLSPHPAFGASSLLRFFPENGQDINGYSSSRWDFWTLTVREIAEQPLIGHAQGSFPGLVQEHFGAYYNHPHNFLVQFPYEIGVPGAFALFFLALVALKPFPAFLRKEQTLAIPAAAGMTALTINAALEGAFFHPLPVLCTLVFISMTAASARNSNHKHRGQSGNPAAIAH